MTLFRRRFDSATVMAGSAVPATAHILCDLRADVAGLMRLFVDVRGPTVAVAHELAEVLDPHATSSVLGLHVYPCPPRYTGTTISSTTATFSRFSSTRDLAWW